MITDAVLSADRVYRYTLLRRWRDGGRTLNIIGLNPSTADETQDDPTIRRCVNFAKTWGFDALVMTNLFGLRATDPFMLRVQHASQRDIVGPDNDVMLLRTAQESSRVLAAWGAHGGLMQRDKVVLNILTDNAARSVYCFGLTKHGHPLHPLYLPSVTEPRVWM